MHCQVGCGRELMLLIHVFTANIMLEASIASILVKVAAGFHCEPLIRSRA